MDSGFILQCSNCGTRNRVPLDQCGDKGKCGKCGSVLIASHSQALDVTDADWEREVAGSVAPVVVVLWSPHCGVCANYELSVQKMASSLYGQARVLRMNVEENPQTPARHRIRGVPTVLLYRGGKLVKLMEGPQGERGIRAALGV